MQKDIFGDLREWDRVMDLLSELRGSRQLDEHQLGLARILRFGRNWQLTERVLSYATAIDQASDLLIAEALDILVSRDVHLDARVLAARALGHLIPCRPMQDSNLDDRKRMVQRMEDLLEGHGLPALQGAISDALTAVHASRGG